MRPNTIVRATLAMTATLLLSCDGSSSPDASTDTLAGRKREVLGALAENVMLPTYRSFADAAAALETATAAYAADRSETNRAAAQQAWIDAMATWETAEMFVFGPAGPPPGVTADFVGEMMLRDAIYSYPFTNTCRIDLETVEGAFSDPDAFASEVVSVLGLDAMQYLLFTESTENTCEPTSAINTDGSWAALGADGVIEARARYAATLAVLVSRSAVTLRDAWEPSGGDFVGTLRTAGEAGSPFPSAQWALDELGTALLYIDRYVKDMKVGEPAGILECPAGGCIEELESHPSGRSKEHVIANVRALRRVYLGGEPGGDELGLDDLLIEVGATDIAADLSRALDDAIAELEALDGTLEEAIASDPAAVRAIYDALTEVSRLLKMDLFSALDIQPKGVPSDTD